MKIARTLILFRKIIVYTVIVAFPIGYGISQLHLSLQRRDQMRNLANMRAIGTAVEAFAVDHQSYPPGNSTVLNINHISSPYTLKRLLPKTPGGIFFFTTHPTMVSLTQ